MHCWVKICGVLDAAELNSVSCYTLLSQIASDLLAVVNGGTESGKRKNSGYSLTSYYLGFCAVWAVRFGNQPYTPLIKTTVLLVWGEGEGIFIWIIKFCPNFYPAAYNTTTHNHCQESPYKMSTQVT